MDSEVDKNLRTTLRSDGQLGSPKLPDNVKNIIIDIDGVVCEDIPNEQPERMREAKATPGIKDKINSWYDQGHIITFFTSRTKDVTAVTEQWLKERGFKYHNIIFGKPRGGNYLHIDDRSIEALHFNGDIEKLPRLKIE